MKRYIAEDFREIKIFNLHDLVSHHHPYVWYRGRGNVREMNTPAVMLSIKGFRFKNTHWTDHGNLSFPCYCREEKKKSFEEAIAKARDLFPEIELVNGPWRDTMVPKQDLENAKKRLNAFRSQKENV